MAQAQTYRTLTPNTTAEQDVSDTNDERDTCLGETQTLILPEREYDAVQALIHSKREPNEEVKNAIERLRNRTW